MSFNYEAFMVQSSLLYYWGVINFALPIIYVWSSRNNKYILFIAVIPIIVLSCFISFFAAWSLSFYPELTLYAFGFIFIDLLFLIKRRLVIAFLGAKIIEIWFISYLS